jgi:hypothetical protein
VESRTEGVCINPHPSQRRNIYRLGLELVFLAGIALPFIYLAIEHPSTSARTIMMHALAVRKPLCATDPCVLRRNQQVSESPFSILSVISYYMFSDQLNHYDMAVLVAVPAFTVICLLFLADLLVFELLCVPLGSVRYDADAVVDAELQEELNNLELAALEQRAFDHVHLGQPPQLVEGGDEEAFRRTLIDFISQNRFFKTLPNHNYIEQSSEHKRSVHRNNRMPIPGEAARAAGLSVGDSVIVRGPDVVLEPHLAFQRRAVQDAVMSRAGQVGRVLRTDDFAGGVLVQFPEQSLDLHKFHGTAAYGAIAAINIVLNILMIATHEWVLDIGLCTSTDHQMRATLMPTGRASDELASVWLSESRFLNTSQKEYHCAGWANDLGLQAQPWPAAGPPSVAELLAPGLDDFSARVSYLGGADTRHPPVWLLSTTVALLIMFTLSGLAFSRRNRARKVRFVSSDGKTKWKRVKTSTTTVAVWSSPDAKAMCVPAALAPHCCSQV